MDDRRYLRRNYYKKSTTRLTGMDQNGWWFTGGSSFMSNGYVIYKSGLDGNPPNPTALLQGNTYAYKLFDYRSTDKRSSYSQFTTHLHSVAERAAENEERFLTLKLQQLRENSNIDVNYLDTIESAVQKKDYSAAYTLLLRRDKDLKEFQREISSNKNQSFAKTNEFFNSQFYTYLAEKFEQQLKSQTGKTRNIDLEEDFDTFVDNFFKERLNISIDENTSLRYIRDTFIEGLKKISGSEDKFKIRWGTFLESAGADLKNLSKKNGATHAFRRERIVRKDNGQFRTPGEIARKIAYGLVNNIGRGLSTEAYSLGTWGGIGTKAFSTGAMTINRQDYFGNNIGAKMGTTDLRIYDVYSAEVSLDDIIEDLYREGYDNTLTSFYEELDRRLQQAASNSSVSDFFEIAVSVKGYMSNYDLKVAGEGSFKNRLGRLNEINLDGNMNDKLVFMLNNTTKDCIMEGREDQIADYIASVCAAWMWDNTEDLFNLNLDIPTNYHKIYLFQSGTAYFTASQIIQQTLNRLLANGDDANHFVQVIVTPPASYGGYTNLMNTFSTAGVQSRDQWQAILQQRWDAVKAAAMETGTLAIHFNQAELNELLGNLKSILGTT